MRAFSDIVRVAGSKRRLNNLKREFDQEVSRLKGINKKTFKTVIDACKEGAEAIDKLLQERIVRHQNIWTSKNVREN